MSSFIRDVQVGQKERQRCEQVNKKTKATTDKIKTFVSGLEMMFKLEENKNTVEIYKRGDFVIYQNSESIKDSHNVYSFLVGIDIAKRRHKAVIAFKRFKESVSKGVLLLGFNLNDDDKAYLKSKYAVCFYNSVSGDAVRFTALRKSIDNGDFQEIVSQLLVSFNESERVICNPIDKNTPARKDMLNHIRLGHYGYEAGHMHTYSMYSSSFNSNPFGEIFQSQQQSLNTAAFLATRQSEKSYAAQQMAKMIAQVEIENRLERLPDIDLDFESDFKSTGFPSLDKKVQEGLKSRELKISFSVLKDRLNGNTKTVNLPISLE